MNEIILDLTTMILQIQMGEAKTTTEMDIDVSYVNDTVGTSRTGASQQSTTNGVTLATILSAPASGHVLVVKQILVTNRDTVVHTFKIWRVVSGGSNFEVFGQPVSVAVGATWDSNSSAGSGGGTTYTGTAPIAVSGSVISLAPDTATAKTTLVGADEILSGDSAASFVPKKTTLTNLWANTVGVLIAALTAKTTPVDADTTEIADSAASNATKSVSLTNLWLNYLKGKADALYAVIGSGGTPYNYLLNGGHDLAQRQTPGTLTTIATTKYGPDMWQMFESTTDWQYARLDATGVAGLTSQYYGEWKKITNSDKGIWVQKLMANNSIPLRSKGCTFQIKMAASSSKTINIAILELQTAGTADTWPSPIASALGANTVDPTWGTNVAVCTAKVACSVTTSIQSFSVTATLPSNSKGYAVAVWTDSQFSANDILYVGEAMLTVGSTVQAWTPRIRAQEIAMCQAFYEKSYDVDTAPGTNTNVGAIDAFCAASSTTGFGNVGVFFKTTKINSAPAMLFWTPGGTANDVSSYQYSPPVGPTNCPASTHYVGSNFAGLSATTTGLTAGAGISVGFHFTAESVLA